MSHPQTPSVKGGRGRGPITSFHVGYNQLSWKGTLSQIGGILAETAHSHQSPSLQGEGDLTKSWVYNCLMCWRGFQVRSPSQTVQ